MRLQGVRKVNDGRLGGHLQNNRHNVTLTLTPKEYCKNNRYIIRNTYGFKRNNRAGWKRLDSGLADGLFELFEAVFEFFDLLFDVAAVGPGLFRWKMGPSIVYKGRNGCLVRGTVVCLTQTLLWLTGIRKNSPGLTAANAFASSLAKDTLMVFPPAISKLIPYR